MGSGEERERDTREKAEAGQTWKKHKSRTYRIKERKRGPQTK